MRFLANAGLIHLEGRGKDYARAVLDPLTKRWDALDGGKWAGFWVDTIDDSTKNRWSTQMQWAWNEPKDAAGAMKERPDYIASAYIWERRKGLAEPQWLAPPASTPANGGEWRRVAGLGTSGGAYALLPVKPGVGEGAALKYDLGESHGSTLVIQFLPDFALWPGMKLRVNVAFDDSEPTEVAVPKSDSNIGEKDPVRNAAVQDNFIRVSVKIPEGAKSVTIFAVDPGVVVDRVGTRENAE